MVRRDHTNALFISCHMFASCCVYVLACVVAWSRNSAINILVGTRVEFKHLYGDTMPETNNYFICQSADQRVSFVRRSVSIDAPLAYAGRSKLLCNLQEHTDDNAQIPLSLSVEELHAWIECVKSLEQQGEASPPFVGMTDTQLIHALKVPSP